MAQAEMVALADENLLDLADTFTDDAKRILLKALIEGQDE